MSNVPTGKVMRLIAVAAILVQIGVVAFHHHSDKVLDAQHAHTWALANVDHHADLHESHDHDHGSHAHDHDDDHHTPGHSDPHDCDLCLLKSSVANGLLAHSSGSLWIIVGASNTQNAHSQVFYRDLILERYGARAPPAGFLIS